MLYNLKFGGKKNFFMDLVALHGSNSLWSNTTCVDVSLKRVSWVVEKFLEQVHVQVGERRVVQSCVVSAKYSALILTSCTRDEPEQSLTPTTVNCL